MASHQLVRKHNIPVEGEFLPKETSLKGTLEEHEVLSIYLKIQQNIGLLQEIAPIEMKKELSAMSLRLLQMKRKLIGGFGDIGEIDLG